MKIKKGDKIYPVITGDDVIITKGTGHAKHHVIRRSVEGAHGHCFFTSIGSACHSHAELGAGLHNRVQICHSSGTGPHLADPGSQPFYMVTHLTN